ncbi:hypothetical protein RM844_30280 [Streptomyces sp. DSM 44915]|uniref:DUF3077 domain-containing protein n=1 Tax=Streptomyces chisholmiae TaxID=3075540 RepID=A0ABU2K015_9ACTN|nr:hypothetical protein [Streptomyces sp. DSM 44915]MDT0270569.1 hypothetical protein [Streptomyces sp. DSM 44915]
MITAESLIKAHAAHVAFVAEEPPATDLHALAYHVTIAAERMVDAGITLAEEMDQAATYLYDARDAEPEKRQVLLDMAADYLKLTRDAVDEYRDML